MKLFLLKAASLPVLLLFASAAYAAPGGSDSRKKIADLEIACQKGDAHACANLGEHYYFGIGVAPDGAKAFEYSSRACGQEDALGCKGMGNVYASGFGAQRDPNKAFELYKKSCDMGNQTACGNLGLSYKTGKVVVQDYKHAVKLFLQACEANDPSGCYHLGEMYNTGSGTDKDQEKALSSFKKSCDGGFGFACIELAKHHEKQPKMNLELIRGFYEQGCKGTKYYGESCYELGVIYASGSGVARDESKALELYQRACNSNYSPACNDAAVAYGAGRGVKKDPKRAFELFQKACDLVSGGLQCSNLGDKYRDGAGTEQDLEKAAFYYQKSCQGGYSRGCSRLAWAYENGYGIEKDPGLALKNYTQACALTVRSCFRYLDLFEKGEAEGRSSQTCEPIVHVCPELGHIHETGRLGQKDLTQAKKYYDITCQFTSRLSLWGDNRQACERSGQLNQD
jgi:TPR repeat protein